LSNAGLSPAEIAVVLGKTPNNVRVQLHYIRKKKGGKSEEVME
jgi:DNA-binding CsgD family transcriptional regulator